MSDDSDRVLKVFAHFQSGPGDVLLANHFVGVGQRRGWDIANLQRGIDKANAAGWIEPAVLGWRLTDAGFAEVVTLQDSTSQPRG